MAKRRSRLGGILGGLLASSVLAGCSILTPYPEVPRDAERGGQTQADLDATLSSIPGLTFATASGSEPNVKGNTGYTFALALDPDYEIADVGALVDFLVASAWSVRTGYMPNSTIDISITVGPEPAELVDLVAGGEEAGWVPAESQPHGLDTDDGGSARDDNPDGYTKLTVWIDSHNVTDPSTDTRGAVANRDRLGEWPGSVPALPTDAVVPRSTPSP